MGKIRIIKCQISLQFQYRKDFDIHVLNVHFRFLYKIYNLLHPLYRFYYLSTCLTLTIHQNFSTTIYNVGKCTLVTKILGGRHKKPKLNFYTRLVLDLLVEFNRV